MKCNICDAGFSEKRDVTSIYEGKKPKNVIRIVWLTPHDLK